MFSEKGSRGVTFFKVRKPVSGGGDKVLRLAPPGGSRDWIQEAPGQARPEVSVFRAGCRKLKMGIRTLEELAVLQKQEAGRFQGTACH